MLASGVTRLPTAWSQETPPEPPALVAEPETIVIVAPPRGDGAADLRGTRSEHNDAEGGLERSVFATEVRVQESEGERRTIGEVLARSVGVTSRSLGGLGAFSSISVRGADAGHTSVSVDGIQLSRIASVTANLGQFELGSFEQVVLYRGGVPPELGGAGVGGALDLQTALGVGPGGKPLQVSAGMGSFGAQHLRARWLGGKRDAKRAYHVSLGYSGADGDFSFFDDGRTPLNQEDDTTEVRQNNGYDRFDLLGRLRQGAWTLGSRTSAQNQGLPGDSHVQATEARLSTLHELLDAQYRDTELLSGALALRGRAFVSLERQHFADPGDEIGLLSQDAVYYTTSTGLGSSLDWTISSAHRLRADVAARLDWFRDTPVGMSVRAPSGGNRQSSSVSISEQFSALDDRLTVDLAVRADAMRTRPSRDVFSQDTALGEKPRNEWHLSPRASGRVRLTDHAAIKSSVGRYLRTATLVEAFGDRGFVLGNPELETEVGVTADAGLVWAPAHAMGPVDRVYVEAVAFASRADKPIVFVNRNGLVAQAINIKGAITTGSELVGSMRVSRTLTLTSNYSFLATRNLATGAAKGKQLPGRPRHRFYARADMALEPAAHLVVLWTDVLRLSGNYVDELNLYELPSRALYGAGVKVEVFQDLLIGLEVKNITNLRKQMVELDPPPREDLHHTPRALSDVHGFPLPGRSLYLNLQWSH